jgi:hypothetical protein
VAEVPIAVQSSCRKYKSSLLNILFFITSSIVSFTASTFFQAGLGYPTRFQIRPKCVWYQHWYTFNPRLLWKARSMVSKYHILIAVLTIVNCLWYRKQCEFLMSGANSPTICSSSWVVFSWATHNRGMFSF